MLRLRAFRNRNAVFALIRNSIKDLFTVAWLIPGLICVVTQSAARYFVVNIDMLDATTELAPPAIARQDLFYAASCKR